MINKKIETVVDRFTYHGDHKSAEDAVDEAIILWLLMGFIVQPEDIYIDHEVTSGWVLSSEYYITTSD